MTANNRDKQKNFRYVRLIKYNLTKLLTCYAGLKYITVLVNQTLVLVNFYIRRYGQTKNKQEKQEREREREREREGGGEAFKPLGRRGGKLPTTAKQGNNLLVSSEFLRSVLPVKYSPNSCSSFRARSYIFCACSSVIRLFCSRMNSTVLGLMKSAMGYSDATCRRLIAYPLTSKMQCLFWNKVAHLDISMTPYNLTWISNTSLL